MGGTDSSAALSFLFSFSETNTPMGACEKIDLATLHLNYPILFDKLLFYLYIYNTEYTAGRQWQTTQLCFQLLILGASHECECIPSKKF